MPVINGYRQWAGEADARVDMPALEEVKARQGWIVQKLRLSAMFEKWSVRLYFEGIFGEIRSRFSTAALAGARARGCHLPDTGRPFGHIGGDFKSRKETNDPVGETVRSKAGDVLSGESTCIAFCVNESLTVLRSVTLLKGTASTLPRW